MQIQLPEYYSMPKGLANKNNVLDPVLTGSCRGICSYNSSCSRKWLSFLMISIVSLLRFWNVFWAACDYNKYSPVHKQWSSIRIPNPYPLMHTGHAKKTRQPCARCFDASRFGEVDMCQGIRSSLVQTMAVWRQAITWTKDDIFSIGPIF